MGASGSLDSLSVVLVDVDDERRRASLAVLAQHLPQVSVQVVHEEAAFREALRARLGNVVLVGAGARDLEHLQALTLAKHEAPELPVIVVADGLGESDVVEAFRHGASDCVPLAAPDRLASALVRAVKEREDRAGRRRAGEALAFSARASAELATSLDLTTTVQRVSRLAVPFLGGYCAVDMLEEGRIRRQAEFALDDFPAALLKALRTPPESPHEAFWAGRPQSFPTFPGTDTPSNGPLRPLIELGLVSLLRLPLRTQGQALGMLTLAVARPREASVATALPLAEDFAHRASLSLDAARLHQELQRSDQRKDEFLAMLAHELRNPLASILAALELLRVKGAAAQLERSLPTAERQAKHMARILDDLLDISRITQGKIELRRQPEELNAIVRDAVQASRPRVEARGLTLLMDLCNEDLPVHADADRIEQVLANLIANGAKFTRPGEKLWVATRREGGAAHVRVRDSGVGIQPEMLPRIFDLFVQGNPSLDRSEGGLGLGLTLVRKLVELHGGTVTAASEGIGHGSEFSVRLPLTVGLRPRIRPSPPPVPLEEPQRKLRVLLVDDNQDLREATGELLRILDHEVLEAADGDEAVRRAQSQRFDVALVDLGLPGLNGYAVAQALRDGEEGSGHRTALVALTGYGQPEHRRRTLQAGFDEHLTKPLGFEQLREVLARVVPPRQQGDVAAEYSGSSR